MTKITEEMREAARRLLTEKDRLSGEDQKLLEAIVNGRRKLIDLSWWRKVYGDIDRVKLDKIAALADPTRNTNEHERQVAAAKLVKAKARRAPGLRPNPPPLPSDFSQWVRVRRTRK